jgi:hypothetical protein
MTAVYLASWMSFALKGSNVGQSRRFARSNEPVLPEDRLVGVMGSISILNTLSLDDNTKT